MTLQVTPSGFTVSGRKIRDFNAKAAGVLSGNASIKGYDKVAQKIKGQSVLDSKDLADLQKLGIDIPALKQGRIMDAQYATQVTASVPTPVQFLQTFLPGIVRVFQDPTVAEELIGYMQVGQWEDAQIVQRVVEWTGFGREYGDNQAKPNTQWLMNFVTRNPVRFEIGIAVDKLQEMRAARGQVSDADEKRGAANTIMEQLFNNVAFYGYNGGNNSTYGFLNDPNLPSLSPVASTGTGSSPLWSTKTFLNICADLAEMHGALTSQTKGRIKSAGADGTPTTLAIATASYQFLYQVQNVQGTQTVMQWYEQNYPNSRIVLVPQLDLAYSSGTLNGITLFAEQIPNITSTDDKQPFTQMIQTKWMPLGVQQMIGGYKEGYSAATAGTLVKYPLAIVRRSSM